RRAPAMYTLTRPDALPVLADGFIGTGAMDAVEEHSINDLKTGVSPKGHALQYGFYYILIDAKLRSEGKENNIIQLREDHLSRKQDRKSTRLNSSHVKTSYA